MATLQLQSDMSALHSMTLKNSAPIFMDAIIEHNTATSNSEGAGGGGLYFVVEASGTFQGCVIRSNSANTESDTGGLSNGGG